MTPPQHRALERIIAAYDDGDPAVVADHNKGRHVHESTAQALIRRSLVEPLIDRRRAVRLIPTDAGRELAAASTPISETR